MPHDIWGLSSPTRDQMHIFCIARQIPNHWATREISKTVRTSQRKCALTEASEDIDRFTEELLEQQGIGIWVQANIDSFHEWDYIFKRMLGKKSVNLERMIEVMKQMENR